MIVIPISNKTVMVRHWFRWYVVQRGATDWKPLEVRRRIVPANIDKIISSIQKSKPVRAEKSPIDKNA